MTENLDEKVVKLLPVLTAARLYHRHEVVGLDLIPREGPVMVVVNHSLATYDIMLLMTAIYSDLGRLPRPLIDRLFFKIPYVGDLTSLFGAMQGSPDNAERLLKEGQVITVAPGGMKEALRPSSERYQIDWQKRLGFVRLAIRSQAPIVLAACPRADDMYDVYSNPLTSWVYQKFRVPMPLARGLGPTPIPRPVKLVHYLSEPIAPPALTDDGAEFERRAKAMHRKLVKRMHALIGQAIQHKG